MHSCRYAVTAWGQYVRPWDVNSCDCEDDSLKSHQRLCSPFGIIKQQRYKFDSICWVWEHDAASNTLNQRRKYDAAIHISHIHVLYKMVKWEKTMYTTDSWRSPWLLHTDSWQGTKLKGLLQRECNSWCVCVKRVCMCVCLCVCLGKVGWVWMWYKCSDHSIQNHSGLLRTDLHTPLGPLLTHTCIIHGGWI